MAKRSYIKAIQSKQSSAYKDQRGSTPAIHQIDGSSKREVSRRKTGALKSFPGAGGASEDMRDAQAEKQMNPHGYSKKKNPVCQGCFVQKAINGSCGCNA